MKTKTYEDFVPVRTPETNCDFASTDPDVGLLPVIKYSNAIASVWVCRSWWYRLRFLFTGRVCLTVLGKGHPPVSISIGPGVHA